MRIEAILWTGVACYLALIGITYLFVSGEVIGVTILLFASAGGGLIGGWLWHWNRSNTVRAEDISDADASAEVGVVGVYPSASMRPLGVAIGMTGVALGVAVGLWMTLAGLAIIASQVTLLVRDADR